MRAAANTNRVKQICPLLIPVLDNELEDYNLQTRSELDIELMKESNGKLKHVHAKLGLAWEAGPSR